MEDPLGSPGQGQFPGSWPQLLVILFFILLAGVFTLFEASLAACGKARLRGYAEERRKYRPVLRALEAANGKNPLSDPGFRPAAAAKIWILLLRMLAGFLAGFNIAGLPPPRAFSGLSLDQAHSAGTPLAIVLYAAVLILGTVLLGDVLPRLAALSAPEKIAAGLFPIAAFFAIPVVPLIALSARFSALVRRLFLANHQAAGMTEDELHRALAEGEKSGIVERTERTMVEGVFYLGDRPVGAFMTHRSEIQWLDINAPAEEFRARALEYRDQRCFPVADGTLDQIAGAVYLEDIILDQIEGGTRGLAAIMRKAPFVPETLSALKAFEAFKKGEANFLFVIDEYGGFAGIVSIRDLMEEIVGELSGSPQEGEAITAQQDGSWLADGSLNIDEAAERLALPSLVEEHSGYHTLAGFVLSLAGELPKTGDSFAYRGFRFTVADMDGNRIDKVLIRPPEDRDRG
ncbi:MAG: hemolysin family protein [Treponema sp.]|jgi:putative hemolysin|nr:hemolysin family protein [Treponema sp.]